MAVTVLPRDTSNLQRQQLLQSGLGDINRLLLSQEQLQESRLSGAANRAYQEALGEQAEATAETTRIKNKIFRANPEATKDFVLDVNASLKSQVFNQKAQIDAMTKLQALETAKLTQQADVAIKNSQAEVLKVKASSAQVMQAMDTQLKKHAVDKEIRDKRLAGFKELIQGMDPAGRVAATDVYNRGGDLNTAGEAGLKASQAAEEAAAVTERTQTIAENRRKEELRKTPKAKKIDALTFGEGTYERRQNAIENSIPVQEAFGIELDLPGVTGRNKKGVYKIDYEEAKEVGKEKEWLQKYETAHGEPFDIPKSSNKGSLAAGAVAGAAGAVKKEQTPVDDKGNPPSDALIKWQEENHPDKTLVFKDGKWRAE